MQDVQNHKGFEDQISSAIASHSRWKMTLTAAIESGQSDWTPEFVAGCDRCHFGAWLDTLPDDMRDAAFANVYRIHQEFHLKAADILRLALAGERQQALVDIAHGSAYARVSVQLISALVSWRSRNKDKFDPTNPRA